MTYVLDYSFYGVLSNMKKIRSIVCLCMLVVGYQIAALDYFSEGERLFRENHPAEAIPLLYQASLQSGTDPRVFNYLGLCYQQTGKYPDAISTFMKGTSSTGTDRKALFFNAGNVYFIQNQFTESESMYSRAIDLDSAYAPAYLNRANARVKQSKFASAIDDYTMYLTLDPATWQIDSIKQIIALLTNAEKNAEEEVLRTAAEKAAAAAEKKAADERYQKLLDTVNSSLQSVDDASTLSAGSEGVMNYTEEGQLE